MWNQISLNIWHINTMRSLLLFLKGAGVKNTLGKFPVYWFPEATIPNCHKLGGLKQQNFIFSQFWKLEVQNQGADRPHSLRRLWRESAPFFFQLLVALAFLGLWLPHSCPCLCLHAAFFPVSLYVSFSVSSKKTLIGFRGHPNPGWFLALYLNYIRKDPTSK